jgi:predicted O-linked N-acetylglucosamine transferase (SPINDLY family)
MKLPAEYCETFEKLAEAWNRAEHSIKSAENICDDVVSPAINELRYAGRKVVESWQLAVGGKAADATERLRDALFDCCRAEHDAIDAATATMAVRMLNATDSMGYDAVLKAFPEFPALKRAVAATQRLAEESRAERNNRQATYALIQQAHFPQIICLYSAFMDSEEMMRGLARTDRRNTLVSRIMFWVGLIGLGVGFASLAVSVSAWRFPVAP